MAHAPQDKQTPPEKRYLFDNPRNVKLLIYLLIAACVLVFGLDFVIHRHIDHPWEEVPAFYAIYGFIACTLLVLISKELRKLLMRKEDYYDD